MKCTICKKNDGNVSGVVKDTYYTGLCRSCFDGLLVDQSVSSGWADYMRSRDFEDHQADIAQPYSKDGKPNSDFIKLYPERAKSMFSDKEIREAM